MQRVQLFSPTGELVTEVTIQKHSITPEVIVWNCRTFVLKAGRYVEAFSVTVSVLIPAVGV